MIPRWRIPPTTVRAKCVVPSCAPLVFSAHIMAILQSHDEKSLCVCQVVSKKEIDAILCAAYPTYVPTTYYNSDDDYLFSSYTAQRWGLIIMLAIVCTRQSSGLLKCSTAWCWALLDSIGGILLEVSSKFYWQCHLCICSKRCYLLFYCHHIYILGDL